MGPSSYESPMARCASLVKLAPPLVEIFHSPTNSKLYNIAGGNFFCPFCVAVKQEIALGHEKIKNITEHLDEAKTKLDDKVRWQGFYLTHW